MFDEVPPDLPPVDEPEEPKGPKQLNWGIYTIIELIRFRDEITKLLPPLTLKEMNLEEEMLLQYHSLRALQNDVLEDTQIALNQRAQVANAVANQLSKLADAQEKVYTQERFKAIESLMIRSLLRLPEETAADFLSQYEKLLASLVK